MNFPRSLKYETMKARSRKKLKRLCLYARAKQPKDIFIKIIMFYSLIVLFGQIVASFSSLSISFIIAEKTFEILDKYVEIDLQPNKFCILGRNCILKTRYCFCTFSTLSCCFDNFVEVVDRIFFYGHHNPFMDF